MLPWDLARLEPRELWALTDGQQERWNRQCELVAWAAYFVVMSIPRLGKSDWRAGIRSLEAFMRKFPPPGYRPPSAKDRARAAGLEVVR